MLDPDISTAAALRHLHRPEPPMSDGRIGLDRRRFLQLVGMGMGAGLVAGPGTSLLEATIPGHDPSVWAAGPLGPNDGVLVAIGMFGGNDGLNTVVPIDDGLYYDQHQPITIAPAETIRLDAKTGLNQNLTEFKRFWDVGQLAIVEGVGHGLDDFSHFSSMARWMSGYQRAVPTSGWIGRWLDQYLGGGSDLFAAAEIGNSLPLHMIGRARVGTTVPIGKPAFGAPTGDNRAVLAAIRALGVTEGPDTWAGRIGRSQVDQLDMARTLAPELPERDDLNAVDIVAKLDVAARLINANLGFRIITAGFGDFDSHAGQPLMHGTRMQELNAAIQQFFARLHPAWGSRVTVMTFSEFGRTSHANDGQGSDHGSSAPHFVFGAKVRGGYHGARPSLAGLKAWDRMDTPVSMADYYGSVLGGWLGGAGGDTLPDFRNDLGLFVGGPEPTPSFPGQSLGQYVALSPRRIYDTRTTEGGPVARIGPGQTVEVQIAGVGGVPAGDVRAVAVNISSIRPSAPGAFLTAYPTGQAKPGTATLNPRIGDVVPNMSIVGVGPNGTISIYNEVGEVDITVDLMGYFRGDAAARILPLSPGRILDTRDGTGAPVGKLPSSAAMSLKVTGVKGVPESGVSAVILNVTSSKPTANGWITAYPTGETEPVVANLSYIAGDVIPNMVICKVGDGGMIDLKASDGDVDLIADVVGCFTTDGAMLSPVAPQRLLDTRDGNGVPGGAPATVGPGGELVLQVTGRGGVPATAKAVVLNVTGIKPGTRTFLTIYPTGETRPLAASLNPDAGKIQGNLVIAKVGEGGRVTIYNEFSDLHVTADLTAYFV